VFVLSNKLMNVKRVLRDYNKKYSGKISDKVLVAKRAMKEAHCLMQTNPSDLKTHRAERILVKEYVRLAEAEESFLRQKVTAG